VKLERINVKQLAGTVDLRRRAKRGLIQRFGGRSKQPMPTARSRKVEYDSDVRTTEVDQVKPHAITNYDAVRRLSAVILPPSTTPRTTATRQSAL
jgi:hypothetical protein